MKGGDAVSASYDCSRWDFGNDGNGGGVIANIDEMIGDYKKPQRQQEEEEREPSGEVLPRGVGGGETRGLSTVLIYDTTLRDETQMESISVSCDDKINITRRLSKFDVIISRPVDRDRIPRTRNIFVVPGPNLTHRHSRNWSRLVARDARACMQATTRRYERWSIAAHRRYASWPGRTCGRSRTYYARIRTRIWT
jgi:hypothetical protein